MQKLIRTLVSLRILHAIGIIYITRWLLYWKLRSWKCLKELHSDFLRFDMLWIRYNSQTLVCKEKQKCVCQGPIEIKSHKWFITKRIKVLAKSWLRNLQRLPLNIRKIPSHINQCIAKSANCKISCFREVKCQIAVWQLVIFLCRFIEYFKNVTHFLLIHT